MQGNVLRWGEIPTSNYPGNVTTSIRRAMTGLLRKTGVSRDQVFGIGIAVTGVIDQTEGMCRYSAALNSREVPIARLVQEATGIPTHIDNDANAVAIGEKLFGR